MILELSSPPAIANDATLVEMATPYLALALYRGARRDKGLGTITRELAQEKPDHFLQPAESDDDWSKSLATGLRLCAESPKDLAAIRSVALRALMESGVLQISKP